MALKPEELTLILREEIENYEETIQKRNYGTVLSVGDKIARVYGLSQVMASELVEFDDEQRTAGLALNLEEDSVGVVLFGEGAGIEEGTKVYTTGKIASVPTGEALLGRVVDPLGRPLDGKGSINADSSQPMERHAAGIIDRQSVCEPLQTGIMAIDAMIPIGRGQRELIIGDRQTGKSSIVLDTILNQKNQADRPYCIYVSIGQRQGALAKTCKMFEDTGAFEYTTVVSAASNDPPALQYLAPYAGMAMAEEFMYRGKHALVIFDDLSQHAIAYRSMSLLLRRPPGREAFPGDVFYLHSRLLERAAKLSDEKGGGSVTALPLVETQAGDVSAYIPTNVISITDGQIFLDTDLFASGNRPAINVGISVSRVGGSAQTKAVKKIAGPLRLQLAQYRELKGFAQFASDLDPSARRQLQRGQKLTSLLIQPERQPLDVAGQVSLIFAGVSDLLNEVEDERLEKFKTEWLSEFSVQLPELHAKLNRGEPLSDEDKQSLREAQSELLESLQAN